ncbi:MAG: Uma2 family endonuclease [Kofleriaceae bacterium]|nr:MAG: Uma2 family endonuclease [Kofleriaceae bacterium]MBZ0237977.1 Uma2 family endonuclease [Kofleriaceae bacterium]
MHPDLAAAITPDRQWRMSVDEYHRLQELDVLGEKDRVELIEGVVVAMSPQSPEHVVVVSKLFRWFSLALDDTQWVVRSQAPLTLARSEPEPDLVIVPTSAIAAAFPRHPSTAALVIEVSKSSLATDRAMAAVYAEAGVNEYWVVDVARRRVEIHREPLGDDYRVRVVAADGVIQPASVPGVQIDLETLWRALP